MSNKLLSVALTLVAGVMILGGLTQGCGGGSTGGSASFTEACNKYCDKQNSCGFLMAPFTVDTCKSICTSPPKSGGAGASGNGANSCGGKTTDQIAAAYNTCIAGECPALDDCIDAICPSGGGAGTGGGAAGTGGGAAGTGGTSAGSTCATACKKADACCKALDPTDDCSLEATCNEAGASSASVVDSCNQVLQLAPAIKTPVPDACK